MYIECTCQYLHGTRSVDWSLYEGGRSNGSIYLHEAVLIDGLVLIDVGRFHCPIPIPRSAPSTFQHVWPPLALITASLRLGMLSTSSWHTWEPTPTLCSGVPVWKTFILERTSLYCDILRFFRNDHKCSGRDIEKATPWAVDDAPWSISRPFGRVFRINVLLKVENFKRKCSHFQQSWEKTLLQDLDVLFRIHLHFCLMHVP